MAILVVEWQGVLVRSWNSKIPLVFAHISLTETLGVRRAREVLACINRSMGFWVRGIHADLVGDAEA